MESEGTVRSARKSARAIIRQRTPSTDARSLGSIATSSPNVGSESAHRRTHFLGNPNIERCRAQRKQAPGVHKHRTSNATFSHYPKSRLMFIGPSARDRQMRSQSVPVRAQIRRYFTSINSERPSLHCTQIVWRIAAMRRVLVKSQGDRLRNDLRRRISERSQQYESRSSALSC